MKSAICLLVSLVATASPAAPALSGTPAPSQSASGAPTPPGALAPASAPAGATTPVNASVGAPALATSSSLTLAALTNGLAGFGFTNQFGTNFTSGDLASVLIGLQNNLQQALFLLGGFNGNLISGGGTIAGGGTASNFAQNLGTGAGVNLAQNLAQNVATPTTSVSPPATPPSVFTQPSQSPVPSSALAPAVGTTTNVSGAPVTPGGSTANGGLVLNDSVRLLIILQNDMERLLPEVAAATGAPFSLPFGNGSFGTNGFIGGSNTVVGSSAGVLSTGTTRIPARTSVTTPRPLTPTGR